MAFLNEIYWRIDPGETPLHSLQWSRRVVPLLGREAEKRRLVSWALDTQLGGVHLLNGPGGAGKTRLAAEVAEILRKKHGWSAGFANYRAEFARLDRKALVIVDYPEEHRGQVEAWLEDSPLRWKAQWLLVSRLEEGRWNWTVSTRVDETTVLGPLDDRELYTLFVATYEAASLGLADDRRSPPSAETFARWLNPADSGERAARRRALFVQAVAVVCVLEPSATMLVDLSVRDIVNALVERELQRLESEGRGLAVGGEDLLPLLVALSGLAPSGLQAAHLQALEQSGFSHFGKEGVEAWIAAANRRTSFWRKGRVVATKPDVLGAALVVKVLRHPMPQNVPEWLWAVLTTGQGVTDDGSCLSRCDDRFGAWRRVRRLPAGRAARGRRDRAPRPGHGPRRVLLGRLHYLRGAGLAGYQHVAGAFGHAPRGAGAG